MPKDEWGVKRVCQHCQTRFYDLNNDPMTCPACGAVMSVESFTNEKARTEKTVARPAKPAAPEVIDTEEDVLDEDENIDVDDELLETDEDDDNVSLEEIADVSNEEDDS